MGSYAKRALLATAAAAIVLAALLAALASAADSAGDYHDPLGRRDAKLPAGMQMLYVRGAARVHPIRPGFLGLSLEYPALESYAGTDPFVLNPVFVQLIRNLAPSQAPVLRIGGDSTDKTWWPVQGQARPLGVEYSLTERWLEVLRALTETLDARLILGLNLEAGSSRLAAAEVLAFASAVPEANIEAFEPGNEPELYGTWTYYRARDGRKMTGRPGNYTFGGFERNFAGVSRAVPGVPLAGPTTGSLKWMRYLRRFVHAEPHLRVVTLHRYPLQVCYFSHRSPRYPTIRNLLAPASSRGLAAIFAPYVAIAHAHGLPLRVDEINTIGCGRASAVADTFASALWALDTLSALAHQGVDGVNVHTYPDATYELFRFSKRAGRWGGRISPEYYGLLAFEIAAPPGSQPLSLSGAASLKLSAWALRAPDGHAHVILINEGSRPQTVGIRAAVAAGAATVLRLSAPHATSRGGIRLAGESFAPLTYTGRLQGRRVAQQVAPIRKIFPVHVPAMSAAIVILP